jgi:hypothetical protein
MGVTSRHPWMRCIVATGAAPGIPASADSGLPTRKTEEHRNRCSLLALSGSAAVESDVATI